MYFNCDAKIATFDCIDITMLGRHASILEQTCHNVYFCVVNVVLLDVILFWLMHIPQDDFV